MSRDFGLASHQARGHSPQQWEFQSREPGFWFGETTGCVFISTPPFVFQSREPGFWFGEFINLRSPRRCKNLFQSREPGFWFGETDANLMWLLCAIGFSPVSRDFGLARKVLAWLERQVVGFQSREPGFWFGEGRGSLPYA